MHLDWHTANFTTKLSRWSSHASTCALVSGLLAISPLAASEVHAYYGFISSGLSGEESTKVSFTRENGILKSTCCILQLGALFERCQATGYMHIREPSL